MRRLQTRIAYADAVSPIIAILLMVAITVVLTSVMYLTVSQLVPQGTQNPQPLGVTVDRMGDNWVVEIVATSSTMSPNYVYMEIANPDGTPLQPYKPISNFSGFLNSDPKEALNAGDRVLLPLSLYPDGCILSIKDDQRLLVQQVLRG